MEQSRLTSSLHDALVENIKNAFLVVPKNNELFHSILRNLQETLVSLKPLLLVQMDPAFEKRFRILLESLDPLIPHLAKFKEKLHEFDTSYLTKLEDLKQSLGEFLTDYVQDRLNRTQGEGGVPNVYQLLGVLEDMIETKILKASSSVKPILEKLKIIMVSLMSKDHKDTSELLSLLERVKVCVQFLNARHGIDIQKYLRIYEQELRRFATEAAKRELDVLDRQYEELRRKKAKEEWDAIRFVTAAIVALLTYPPQTRISSILFTVAVTIFVSLLKSENPEKAKHGYSDIVNLIFAGTVVALFTYPIKALLFCVIVIGALIVYVNLFKPENPDFWLSTEDQRKKPEDQSERDISIDEDEFGRIMFFAATIFGTGVACIAYWQNTPISCFFFIFVIVQLTNFRSKTFVRQIRNANDALDGVIKFFTVILVIGAVILLVSIFKPKIPDEEEINNEIFLSFRGSDTRYGFASSLHNNLEKENIRTFFDERKMQKGKPIWEELQKEIRTSVGAIIIVSENYTDSEDCLDELLQIQKRSRTYNRYILEPIFYDVRASHLTDKRSKLHQALQKHRNTKKIKEWAAALETLAGNSGYSYRSDRDHMDVVIDIIVGDVKKYLRTKNGRHVRKHI